MTNNNAVTKTAKATQTKDAARVTFERVANGEFTVSLDGVKTRYQIVNGSAGYSGRVNTYGIIRPDQSVVWIGSLQAAKKAVAFSLTRKKPAPSTAPAPKRDILAEVIAESNAKHGDASKRHTCPDCRETLDVCKCAKLQSEENLAAVGVGFRAASISRAAAAYEGIGHAKVAQVVRALGVVVLTPHIAAYLAANDPQALAQIERALAALPGADFCALCGEAYPEHHASPGNAAPLCMTPQSRPGDRYTRGRA